MEMQMAIWGMKIMSSANMHASNIHACTRARARAGTYVHTCSHRGKYTHM